MKVFKLLIFAFFLIVNLSAKTPLIAGGDCAPPTTQKLLAINKIRAKLASGGDIWWRENGLQTFNPFTGELDSTVVVNGASIWVGGIDPGGSLKLAANTGNSDNQPDFYPGPLNQFTGTTDRETCRFWDRHFSVTKEEIETHMRLLAQDEKGEIEYTEDMIPDGVKGWPAKGNPHFAAHFGFDLPSTGQGLALYYDAEPINGIYDPLNGDFPAVVGSNIDNEFAIPDEIVFRIFNDAGGIHLNSNADPIQMEFQMTSYAYNRTDYLDYATFHDVKLINRAVEDIKDAYFGLWMDVDGDPNDIIFGCDTTRELSWYYNRSSPTTSLFSVDVLKSPIGESNIPLKDANGEILLDPLTLDTIFSLTRGGLESFTYYNEPRPLGGGCWPIGTVAPQSAEEFYTCLTSRWRDGSHFSVGGNGYDPDGQPTKFVFPDSPDCQTSECWTMCEGTLTPNHTQRTLMSMGNFKLKPGDVNNLTFATNWIPDHPADCPNLDLLYEVSDYNEILFQNKIVSGMYGPEIEWEVEKFSISGQIIYEERIEDEPFIDLLSPDFLSNEEKLYQFEGYQVFQIKQGYDFSKGIDVEDSSNVRLVYQTDIANGIGKIYNWEATPNPDSRKPPIWRVTEMVKAANPDQGLERNFKLTEDAFEEGDDKSIQPNRYYHYAVRTYAHNNWKTFDPFAGGGIGSGQKNNFLSSWLRHYTVGKIISFENTIVVPNPSFSDGEVWVKNIPIGSNISLFDAKGALMEQWKNVQEETWQLEKIPLQSGMYFFRLEHPEIGEIVLKWIYFN